MRVVHGVCCLKLLFPMRLEAWAVALGLVFCLGVATLRLASTPRGAVLSESAPLAAVGPPVQLSATWPTPIAALLAHYAATSTRPLRVVPIRDRAAEGIPYMLHYTSKEAVDTSLWRRLNPSLDIRFYNDEQLASFIAEHWPNLHANFGRMRVVEKADIFRYVALWVLGGFYTDIDVTPVVPLLRWPRQFQFKQTLHQLDFILGIELSDPQQHAESHTHLPFQLCQWTMASAARNPMLEHVLRHVEQNIHTIPDTEPDSVLVRTGPLAWTAGIVDFLAKYADPPGYRPELGPINYPASVLEMPELEQHGALVEFEFDGRRWCGLLLPNRAFGYHQVHQRSNMYRDHLVIHQVCATTGRVIQSHPTLSASSAAKRK